MQILELYLDELLNAARFSDYCPNGMQVLGRKQIKRVMTGVSGSQELIKAAVSWQADLILVHHGILWDKDPRVVRGSYKKRLQLLLTYDLNLMAYHLPLDAHPKLGNNAQILEKLQLIQDQPFGLYRGHPLSFVGRAEQPILINDFFKRVTKCFGGKPLILPFGPKKIQRVAVCSGGAPELIREARECGADLFLTGEASEFVYHYAKEEKINFIAAGHHRTETLGVQAVGQVLQETFGLTHRFYNIPNPI
ncbi:MAG: Nif3-like dinuclear metal center hexameric protein [Magnetococcales bacterium]|nr:Nif3-like dinuclear metal center hexameric protein [Magnetococcales bacterium]